MYRLNLCVIKVIVLRFIFITLHWHGSYGHPTQTILKKSIR